MEIFDHLGRKLQLKETPRKIVSLVPSQTELLVDLGLKDHILGITKFCVHPKKLRKEKMVVGRTKSVHYDKIASLNPDIILCNKEENTQEMVAELEKIAPVHVSEVSNIADSFQLIQDYGQIFNTENVASALIKTTRTKIDVFFEEIKNKKITSCIYLIWKDPYMAAGSDTFINELLKLNKLENKITGSRYPVINLEELCGYSPDWVLLSSEPYPFKQKHLEQINQLGLKAVLVDGEYFSWYGSRLIKAIDYFYDFIAQLSISE